MSQPGVLITTTYHYREQQRGEAWARSGLLEQVSTVPNVTSLPLSAVAEVAAGFASEGRSDYQQRVFELPEWFNPRLDPHSAEYLAQQLKLWQEISGRTDPASHLSSAGAGSIERPSIYDADPAVAGEHLITLGVFLSRCGLRRGGTALEYGASFDHVATALTRLGVTVQTVAADAGSAPPGQRFELVYFYETFQSCFDFQELIPRLHDRLAPGGRVILAAEPIVADDSVIIPGPWGIRMDVESVVRARERGTMELGFQQSYLLSLFVRAGFVWEQVSSPLTTKAELWVLDRRPGSIELATHSLTPWEEMSWHGAEPSGRWTRYRSWLYIDESADSIEVCLANHHPVERRVALVFDGVPTMIDLPPGGRRDIRLAATSGQLAIECEPLIPRSYGIGDDARELGIFVETVKY